MSTRNTWEISARHLLCLGFLRFYQPLFLEVGSDRLIKNFAIKRKEVPNFKYLRRDVIRKNSSIKNTSYGRLIKIFLNSKIDERAIILNS